MTAGGWALEAMAVRLGVAARRARPKPGRAASRPRDGQHHLYVIKSGLVTRNSDI